MDALSNIEQKKAHYLLEIASRTPPKDSHDEFMLGVYQRLLDDIEWFLRLGGSRQTEVPECIDNIKILN